MMRFILIGFFLLIGCGPVQFSSPGPQPTPPNPPTPPTPQDKYRDVEYNGKVEPAANKLDILMVVDDSNSMLSDNRKLGDKLATFASNLQGSIIDWQMCVTVTRQILLSDKETKAWGASIYWQNYTPPTGTPKYILKSGTSNLDNIFRSTIEFIGAGWSDSDDERGIKAAFQHIYNGDPNFADSSGCHRKDTALAIIIISDEDERSVGGDANVVYYPNELKPLESEDQPDTLINQVKTVLGGTKRWTANSIIVKPGDTACMSAQDGSGSKSHFGKLYNSLSKATGGAVGSICDTDYSNTLKDFLVAITNNLSSLPLECTPVETPTVTITPTLSGLSFQVSGSNLNFSPAIPQGSTINVKYKCSLSNPFVNIRDPGNPGDRIPASDAIQNEGFMASLIKWWKGLLSLWNR